MHLIWIITKIWFQDFCIKFYCRIIFIYFSILTNILIIINNIPFCCVQILNHLPQTVLKDLLFFDFPFLYIHTKKHLKSFVKTLKLFVLFFFFLMIKNNVVFCSSFPIKSMCYLKSEFSNSVYLLKSIEITL